MLDRLARRDAERTALGLVADEVGHPRAQVVQVAGAVQPSVDAGAYEVERSPDAGRDDRHSARVRLLDRLAERLALTRMHEDVEARDGLGELETGEVAAEEGLRHPLLQTCTHRTVADDDEPDAGQIAQRGEILHLLLGGEAPHVPDDHSTGRDVRAPRVAAAIGAESRRVDAARPPVRSRHTQLLELAERRR